MFTFEGEEGSTKSRSRVQNSKIDLNAGMRFEEIQFGDSLKSLNMKVVFLAITTKLF